MVGIPNENSTIVLGRLICGLRESLNVSITEPSRAVSTERKYASSMLTSTQG